MAVGVIEEKGQGKCLAGPRAPPLPLDAKLKMIRRKVSPRSYDSREGDSQQALSLPLVILRRRKREREKNCLKSRVGMAEFKF
jgi:hypothetical protein